MPPVPPFWFQPSPQALKGLMDVVQERMGIFQQDPRVAEDPSLKGRGTLESILRDNSVGRRMDAGPFNPNDPLVTKRPLYFRSFRSGTTPLTQRPTPASGIFTTPMPWRKMPDDFGVYDGYLGDWAPYEHRFSVIPGTRRMTVNIDNTISPLDEVLSDTLAYKNPSIYSEYRDPRVKALEAEFLAQYRSQTGTPIDVRTAYETWAPGRARGGKADVRSAILGKLDPVATAKGLKDLAPDKDWGVLEGTRPPVPPHHAVDYMYYVPDDWRQAERARESLVARVLERMGIPMIYGKWSHGGRSEMALLDASRINPLNYQVWDVAAQKRLSSFGAGEAQELYDNAARKVREIYDAYRNQARYAAPQTLAAEFPSLWSAGSTVGRGLGAVGKILGPALDVTGPAALAGMYAEMGLDAMRDREKEEDEDWNFAHAVRNLRAGRQAPIGEGASWGKKPAWWENEGYTAQPEIPEAPPLSHTFQ